MRLKYKAIADPEHLKHYPTEYFQLKVKNELSRAIEKYIDVKVENDEEFGRHIFTGDIVVLPTSQLDHVKGMLTTLKGFGPESDMVIKNIWAELCR